MSNSPTISTAGSEGGKDIFSFEEFYETIKSVRDKQMRKNLEKTIKKFKKQISNQRKEQLQKLKNKINELKMKNEDPKFLVKRDEVIYSLVLTSLLFTVGLLFYPDRNIKFAFIFIKLLILIIHRFFDYKKRKWHYYMIEYCYFANLFMFLIFLFWRNNKFLLATFFVNAMGPVASSFFFFRFSITWHDLSTYTSFFLHFAPISVAWIMRFYVTDRGYTNQNQLPTTVEWDNWLAEKGWAGYWQIMLGGNLFYYCWMIPYYFLRFHALDGRINRKGNDSLFHHASENSGLYQILLKKFNKKGSVIMKRILYMSMHATITFFAFFYSTMLIYYNWLTILTVVALTLVSIWSSSTYYLEYFTKKYDKNIMETAEKNRQERLDKEMSQSCKDKND